MGWTVDSPSLCDRGISIVGVTRGCSDAALAQWSESGAHNLLQVRTKVLNDQLWETLVRWYPGMQTEQETEIEKKAA